MTYTVVLVREEVGGYSVHVPALKGCHTQGETVPEALEMAKEAILCYLGSLEKRGKRFPSDVDTVTFDWDDGSEALVYRLPVGEAAPIA
jgi:predicted RNase H-like HicB family nuclease